MEQPAGGDPQVMDRLGIRPRSDAPRGVGEILRPTCETSLDAAGQFARIMCPGRSGPAR